MMSVHVPPGATVGSFIAGGAAWPVGVIWIDFIGRISVAALSFISGYLLVATRAREKGFVLYFTNRLSVIYIPMLFWGSVYIVMRAVRELMFVGDHGYAFETVADVAAFLLTDFSGLLGPTANGSLFFIRDLFVAGVLVKLGLEVLRRAPILTVVALCFVSVFDLAEPIIFRPNILLFMACGAAAALHGFSLSHLGSFRVAGPIILLSGGVAAVASFVPSELSVELINISKRVGLTVAFLMATAYLVNSRFSASILIFEPSIFLTYLLHVPLFGIIWVVWSRLIGGAQDPSYGLFFVAAPVLAILAGSALGHLLNYAPSMVQAILRGQIKRKG